MDNTEFVRRAVDAAQNRKTLYVMGCFGAPMNSVNKVRYTSNHPYNTQTYRKNKINEASYDTFGFDCICFIKGLLWGWNANVNGIYGGAVYKSNGVDDDTCDGMLAQCVGVSSNFSNIVPGEMVYMPGHVGIYIGEGLAVECTPIWKDGVQITAVGNIGSKTGYNTRIWQKHGKLKFINYKNNTKIETQKKSVQEIAHEVCLGKWGNYPERKTRLNNAGYNYEEVQAIVNKLVGSSTTNTSKYYKIPNYNGVSIVDALKSIGVDSSFSNRSKIAYRNGYKTYSGTPEENLKMLSLLKNGKLLM